MSGDGDGAAPVQGLHRPQDIMLAPSQDQPDSQVGWWWWWAALLYYKYWAATRGHFSGEVPGAG